MVITYRTISLIRGPRNVEKLGDRVGRGGIVERFRSNPILIFRD